MVDSLDDSLNVPLTGKPRVKTNKQLMENSTKRGSRAALAKPELFIQMGFIRECDASGCVDVLDKKK